MQNCGGSILETIENQNKIIRIQNQTIDRLAIVAMQHGEIDDESLREIEQTSGCRRMQELHPKPWERSGRRTERMKLTEETIEAIKMAITWMAGIGIVIDLTPGIKVYPIRWLLKQIGSLLFKDAKDQIEILNGKVSQIKEDLDEFKDESRSTDSQIKEDLAEHKTESRRAEILDFANSCMNHRKHTQEEFKHIIKLHDEYSDYVEKHKIKNGEVKVAYKYIEEIYQRRISKNDFLTGNVEDDPEDK
jgi:hypothetical protein